MQDDSGSQSMPDAVGQKMPKGDNWCHGSMEFSFRVEDDRGLSRILVPDGHKDILWGVAIMGGRGKHDHLKFQLFIQEGG